jgi:tRNA G37 N-methylase Trm5
MRHLRVPSTETAQWRERLLLAGWLAGGVGIQSDGDHRLLPLNDRAPDDADAGFEGHAIVQRASLERGPQHWRERLPPNLLATLEPSLPTAHEVQGDVLLVKLEPEVEAHSTAIAEAMLAQFSHVRVVCLDRGVTGPFRIRDLRVLAARGADASTETTVREHGLDYTLDPATAYFSARLSREREAAMALIKAHKALLGRRLIAHDPYAGVGPNLGLPLHDGAIEVAVVGDLNGHAIPYLRNNLSRIIGKSAHPEASLVVREGDGRDWQHDPELKRQADVLFVNLPHEGLDHLTDLIPLLADDALVLGWAVVDRHQEEAVAARVQAAFGAAGRQADVDVQATKGFSTTRTMVRLVVRATTGS